MEDRRRRIYSRVLVVSAIALVFLSGVISGGAYERSRQKVDLNQFWNVYGLLERRYVGEIDPKKASDGAVQGLVESLGDPYSAYLPEEEKKKLDEELSGSFEGIGAVLSQRNKQTIIVELIEGSPASKSTLKVNDTVVAVDDVPVEGLVLEEVVAKIRGPKDTSVVLTVARDGTEQPIKVTVTRADIQVKSVTSSMKGTVGYIDIAQFGDDTVDAVKAAIEELKKKKATAYVVDLRDNPGGYLNAVPPIAGQFLPPSVIVKERYKSGKVDSLRSVALPVIPDAPLYVLVNGGSASASEILAGALQDYGRAKLIGEKTFGKGSVQDIIPLYGNTALRLTIAEWLTPKDRAINKKGIEPDVTVADERTDGRDPVLEKALELAAGR